MIIFLYGQDGHRIRQEANSIEEKYKKKYPNGVNLLKFDLAVNGGEKLEDAIKTASFFEEVKLIVLKNSFTSNDTEHLCKLIEDYDLKDDKLTVLLFNEFLPGKDLKTKDKQLFSLLENDQNLVRNFESLDGAKLDVWIKKEFSNRDCSISPASVRKLIQLAGPDTNRLMTEIIKLSNYKLKGEITPADIEGLVINEI